MFQRFYGNYDYKLVGDFVKHTPIVDLGYMNAEQRIMSILQAGQVLQEARASQFSYQDVNMSDDMNAHDNDMSAIVYCDKMEAKDYAMNLDEKKLSQLANAIKANNKPEASVSSAEASQSVEDSSKMFVGDEVE